MPVETLAVPSGVDLACWNNVGISWQHGVLDLDAARTLIRVAPRFRRRHPGGTFSLAIIEPGVPPPESAARRELTTAMSEPGILGMAVAVEQLGFRGSLVRGVMSGLVFAARARFPLEVHATVADSARWLASLQKPPPPGWADELARDVAAYREARRAQLAPGRR